MTISEVSKKYNLSCDTLRYYERIGLIPSINRTNSGIRDYTEEDCLWVEFIKCMRSVGLPIEALIEYITLFQQGRSTENARKELLIEQRNLLMDKMNDIQKVVQRLNKKIDRYDKVLMEKEEALIKDLSNR